MCSWCFRSAGLTWGPCSVVGSKGLPTILLFALSILLRTNSSYMDSSTKMREPAVQHWPALKNTPWCACSTARSTEGRKKQKQTDLGFFFNSNIKSDTREGVFVISLINKQGTLDQSELTKEIAIMTSPQSSLCVLRWAKHLLELAWKSDTGHLRDRTLLLRMKG